MKYLVLDIETTSLDPFRSKLHGIAASKDGINGQYYFAEALPSWLTEGLANPSIIKVGHNVRCFDLNFLMHNVGSVIAGPIYDTLLMSMVYDDSLKFHGLKQLTAHYLGDDSLTGKNELDATIGRLKLRHVGQLCELDLHNPARPYAQLIGKYAVEDHDNTWNLFQLLKGKLEKQHKDIRAIDPNAQTPLLYFKNELAPTESMLLKMELDGVRVDPAVLKDIKETCEGLQSDLLTQFTETCSTEIAAIQSRLIEETAAKYKREDTKAKVRANPAAYDAVFNINSPYHMAELVYDKLECPPALVKRTKTGRSMAQDHLNMIEATVDEGSKLAQALEIYSDVKKVTKTLGTYVGNEDKGITSLLQVRGEETRLYPNYKQRTATGRLSVFPIQQLPREHNNPHAAKIKRFFIPSTPEHCFIYSDESQIELRNAAHLSQDPTLMRLFNEGADLHSFLAAKIFKCDIGAVTKVQRQVGKTCNFLLLYGGSAGRLMQQLAVKEKLKFSKEECEKFRRGFFQTYPQYEAYLESVKAFAEKHGYVVAENGRIRHVPDIQYGKYLDHTAKVFFGPPELRETLLEYPGQKLYGDQLYWLGNGRYRHALNAAYNSPNQGLGATIIKTAMKQITESGLVLAAQIHDAVIVESLLTQADETAARVKKIMETCYSLTVPLKSDTKIIRSFDEADVYAPKAAA